MRSSRKPLPVIDLFAGPGGLGEGFARYPVGREKKFKIALSIEKDPDAHKTLTLRSFFRQFKEGRAPTEYYDYLRGEISKDTLFQRFPKQAAAALAEARLLTLGEDNPHGLIRKCIHNCRHWVLIGGPPCQAYSLMGRSKILGGIKKHDGESDDDFNRRRYSAFERDERHELYKQYLAIIANHWPSVFVMENVRGILSSKLGGNLIFPKILNDLSNPASVFPNAARSHKYRIYSLATSSRYDLFGQDPSDFLIQCERYGVPQARHRVILLGIRDDLDCGAVPLLEPSPVRTVRDAIGDMPKLTSGVTKAKGVRAYDALKKFPFVSINTNANGDPCDRPTIKRLSRAINKARRKEERGARFLFSDKRPGDWWITDPRLQGVCNHESRSHIKEDLWRYVFAAAYAECHLTSPQLKDFPQILLPKHANVQEAVAGEKFGDRFRVQVADKPSSTITSHISKDGHYFIHYDPLQYRSLTVREAARLQTFPDNYFFEGTRTSQYHQVGNAVPPYLAYQVANIVSGLFDSMI